jgi:hypothetical protein
MELRTPAPGRRYISFAHVRPGRRMLAFRGKDLAGHVHLRKKVVTIPEDV